MKTTNDTKQHIINTGIILFAQKGFSAVGLAEILKEAEVPKGSFYHYFASKEAFGQAVLQNYFENYCQRLQSLFEDTSLTIPERLLEYWQRWQKLECEQNGCLVVKLSAEVADLSELMRTTLQQGCQSILNILENHIKTGQNSNCLPQTLSAQTLATTLYYLWLGASLHRRLTQDNSCFAIVTQQTNWLLSI